VADRINRRRFAESRHANFYTSLWWYSHLTGAVYPGIPSNQDDWRGSHKDNAVQVIFGIFLSFIVNHCISPAADKYFRKCSLLPKLKLLIIMKS